MKPNYLPRRQLLRLSWMAGASALLSKIAYGASTCSTTPAQTEGPFYPVTPQRDRDWDLTRIEGRAAAAVGKVVIVEGVIQDAVCKRISGALVEIWQACHTGKYNHPRDPNQAALDPNFQYWGRLMTGADGRYRFKTIIPGAYPANETWVRPPHIHFKVSAPGHRPFATQMYFKGDALNASDLILQSLTPQQRELVEVTFALPESGGEVLQGQFNITLNLAGAPDATPELD